MKLKKIEKQEICCFYSKILTSLVDVIVSRWDRSPGYGWIDTKINLVTGEDYADSDILKGKSTVYSWIQGRALEALTCHARWLEHCDCNAATVDKLKAILRQVLLNLEKARRINGGHLYFFLDKDGKAFKVNPEMNIDYFSKTGVDYYNFSDLFCAKGMYTAAKYLGLKNSVMQASEFCRQVEQSLWDGNFASDQFSFRGKISSSGRVLNSTGPYMLMLSTASMFLETDTRYAVDTASKLIDRLLGCHFNLNGSWSFGSRFDCIENVDPQGLPLISNNMAESDPGHSIEFTGLALRFIAECKRSAIDSEMCNKLETLTEILVRILVKNFENGYVESLGGICKGFDLISRDIIDSDMPWWSLPETMRAAMFGILLSKNDDMKETLWGVFHKCHQAFVENYVRKDLNFMAVQTRGRDGKVKNTIPATPDADPGYHTGICLIDCYNILNGLS